MKDETILRAVQLKDDDIAFCISTVCSKLLSREVHCRVFLDDNEYWGAISDEQKFTIKEMLDLCVAVNADAECIRDTLPIDTTASGSLGMDLSRQLLKLALGTDWVWEHILDYGLILIGLPTEGFHVPTEASEIPTKLNQFGRSAQQPALSPETIV
jgi:hypothetical protein